VHGANKALVALQRMLAARRRPRHVEGLGPELMLLFQLEKGNERQAPVAVGPDSSLLIVRARDKIARFALHQTSVHEYRQNEL
jgi:hypothetical protein